MRWVEVDPLPELQPPEGGWREITCTWESHTWHLWLEDGKFSIQCADPCDLNQFDPAAGKMPLCHWEFDPEDCGTPEPIPVRLTYVDDSTPSTPMGPAEYGFYIEVGPAVGF
jgi:hypothetical protein